MADFCIADISITSPRAKAFTFSMPWLVVNNCLNSTNDLLPKAQPCVIFLITISFPRLNLGISILYIPPRSAPPSLMAFKEPLSSDVYIAILVIFIFAAFIIYFLARLS